MARIVILGAGVMGSAMTLPAAHAGNRITLVGTHLDEEIIGSVAGTGHHPRLNITLPGAVTACSWTDFGAAMKEGPDLLVLGVSSAGVPWAIDRIAESIESPAPILMITKGLAASDAGIEILPHLLAREIERRTALTIPVMAVGGPCIAGELAAQRDTSVIVAGHDPDQIAAASHILRAPFYHMRPSSDLVGVEICAAFKNFYTLAVGAPIGLLERDHKVPNGALMHNLASSLFSQSLAEMAILVEALGGRIETVQGLAGSGDLYVTCQAGRNGRMGRLLGRGLPYSVAKREHMSSDTVEGAQLALDLGQTLEKMMAQGLLPGDHLPLTAAIIDAICHDAPLGLSFDRYHRC
ncbi:glycerol-3-phosphate dehydrogenase [Mesorhizobium sp. B2-3-11]|uniref:glycerol-3-phosphate dehydrogenase n=1 Tax=Mesorhizobium sp. B2-3-11 TaxID=2589953 RepID=UPI00112C09DF|nr:glycerol-3-phosphate dehydrogenase [Mesorhizobium sp. B2-3-11]TPM05483.1 glycerol-3-phosphate dehydrogenase [Mesorhizobium sp. B2-3-11]